MVNKAKYIFGILALIIFSIAPFISVHAINNDALSMVPQWAEGVIYINVPNLLEMGVMDSLSESREFTNMIDDFSEIGFDFERDIEYIIVGTRVVENFTSDEDGNYPDFIMAIRANFDIDEMEEFIEDYNSRNVSRVSTFTSIPLFSVLTENEQYIYVGLLSDYIVIAPSEALIQTSISLYNGRVSSIRRNNEMIGLINSVSSANVLWMAVNQNPFGTQPFFTGVQSIALKFNAYRNDEYQLELGLVTSDSNQASSLMDQWASIWELVILPEINANDELAGLADAVLFDTEGAIGVITVNITDQIIDSVQRLMEGDFQ